MAAKWIPPTDRSKFMANMMASSLGAALTMPFCGVLITYWGWTSVFYATGVIGILWSVAWFCLIYDSPDTHPRISAEERQEIEFKIAQDSKGVAPNRVPWRQIVFSVPVWTIIVTNTCCVFAYFIVINQLPTYMKDVLRFEIKKNGLLTCFPHLGKYLIAITSSYLADKWIREGRWSVITIRKFFTMVGMLIPALFMIVLALFGDDPLLSVIIFTCCLSFSGAVTGGYLVNCLDIAPNFSGTIMGLANTASSFGGWLSTFIVALLTHATPPTFQQWSYVFWIMVGVYAVGTWAFCVHGRASLQPWNSAKNDQMDNVKMRELQPLNRGKSGGDAKDGEVCERTA